MKKQQGFTLVEIAIVMVIIGLLLGGVLKGQEVITNARLKRVVNDFNGLSAAVFSYQDRYRALPGDDLTAANKFTNTPPPNGDGDGRIEGNFDLSADTEGPLGEARRAWRHLREAGLVAGGEDTSDQPSHAYGGVVGIEENRHDMRGHSVCFDSVDGDNAQLLDIQNDDGIPNAGALRSGTENAANNNGGTTYDPAVIYNLCFRM